MIGSLEAWMAAGVPELVPVFLTTIAMFAGVTLASRLVGLRSFAKMSSTDFVTTVAIGSLIASVISAPEPTAALGLAALAAIFALKWCVAAVRRRTRIANVLLDNQPRYLMRGEQILHHNLAAAEVSVSELHEKLRQANVWSYSQVVSVVLETTGDVSVLTRPAQDAEVTEAIFANVRSG
jgi:uncharacterized membrane protein YcaP (DUF421 family)